MNTQSVQDLKKAVEEIEDYMRQVHYHQTADGYEPPNVQVPTDLWDQLVRALNAIDV